MNTFATITKIELKNYSKEKIHGSCLPFCLCQFYILWA